MTQTLISDFNQKHHILLYKAYFAVSFFGSFLRFVYSMKYGRYIEKSDLRIVTRIPLIDQNMLTIPLIIILASLVIVFFNLKYALNEKSQKTISVKAKTLIR